MTLALSEWLTVKHMDQLKQLLSIAMLPSSILEMSAKQYNVSNDGYAFL